jgi:hypothetical protein
MRPLDLPYNEHDSKKNAYQDDRAGQGLCPLKEPCYHRLRVR